MIEVSGLSHAYGDTQVLRDVGFTVPPGRVLGLVGPNGAGKTTTLRAIATLLRPSAGQIRVCGFDVLHQPESVRRAMGFLPEGASVYRELRVWEQLDFFAHAAGLAPAERSRRVAAALEALEHMSRASPRERLGDALLSELSKGQRQMVSLQSVLIHRPRALILDEPTDGLDPLHRADLLKALKVLAREGAAVLLTSHILSEVEQAADECVILAEGRVHATAPSAKKIVRVWVRAGVEAARELLAERPELCGAVTIESSALQLELPADAEDGGDVVGCLVREGFVVTGVEALEHDLGRRFEAVVLSRDGS